MRKVLISIFAIALFAGLTFGDIATSRVKADFTSAAQASNEVSEVVQISGFLQQIDIIPSGVYTAGVTITYTPIEGTAVNIYTNTALTAQTILRPGVTKTGDGGSALSSDDLTRWLLNGGSLTVTVTNVNKTAATSAVVIIKTEK